MVTTGEEHKTANSFQFDEEAVCIPLISSTGHGHASLKRVHYLAGKFALGNLLAAALVKNKSILSTKFLARYLTFTKDRLIVPLMTGAANMSISVDRLASVPIEFPSLLEQERIVKQLDEVNELQEFRVQANHRCATLVPALFHEMFGENQTRIFERLRLEETAEVVSGVAKGRKFNGTKPVEVPYLRVANVQDGHIDLSEIKTIQALPEEVKELALKKGDVVLTEGGDYDKLGRGAMLEQDIPNCIHQNHVFRVRVDRSKLEPSFFAKYLMTAEAKGYFLGCAKRTTNLASINMRQLRALPVPIPPLSLQKEFVQRVAEIRELETSQATSRTRLDALFQSMLHRAFNGEL